MTPSQTLEALHSLTLFDCVVVVVVIVLLGVGGGVFWVFVLFLFFCYFKGIIYSGIKFAL